MITQYATLTMAREELVDFHRALIMRYVVENNLRREQGLEPIDPPSLIQRCERVLNVKEEEAHELFHHLEDELWAFSWYSYTDEWAWFRAKQEVERSLGAKLSRTKRETLERMVEEKYEEKFEKYIAEVDMQSDLNPKKSQKQNQKKKT